MVRKQTKVYPESFRREAVRLADLPDRTAVIVRAEGERGSYCGNRLVAATVTCRRGANRYRRNDISGSSYTHCIRGSYFYWHVAAGR